MEKNKKFLIELDSHGKLVSITGKDGVAKEIDDKVDFRDMHVVTIHLAFAKPKDDRKFKPKDYNDNAGGCADGQCQVWNQTLHKYVCVNC